MECGAVMDVGLGVCGCVGNGSEGVVCAFCFGAHTRVYPNTSYDGIRVSYRPRRLAPPKPSWGSHPYKRYFFIGTAINCTSLVLKMV